MAKPIPTTPAFCYITPISYMHMYAGTSSRHLVLAHLVDRHPEYAAYYKERSDQGDYIMMDNSAYELKEPYSPSKLVELGDMCGADAIVLPDYPFQPAHRTIDAAQQFIPEFKAAGFATFFVPQSERYALDDWMLAYRFAVNDPGVDIIGMSILGIPNAIPSIDPAFARVVLTHSMISKGEFAFNKPHHYLGLNSGPALEIPSLLRMGALTSIDSSGPVWAGILGHAYTTGADSFQQVKKLKMPVVFDIPVSRDAPTHNRIRHNIELTELLFNNIEVDQAWYADE